MLTGEMKDYMTRAVFGMPVSEAMQKGICLNCKEEALPKCYSEAGRKEYALSGLCEVCFDQITKSPEEEEE